MKVQKRTVSEKAIVEEERDHANSVTVNMESDDEAEEEAKQRENGMSELQLGTVLIPDYYCRLRTASTTEELPKLVGTFRFGYWYKTGH